MKEIDHLRRQNIEFAVQIGRLQQEIEQAHLLIDEYTKGILDRVLEGNDYSTVAQRMKIVFDGLRR